MLGSSSQWNSHFSKRDNDQQNHWVFRGLAYFQTHPYTVLAEFTILTLWSIFNEKISFMYDCPNKEKVKLVNIRVFNISLQKLVHMEMVQTVLALRWFDQKLVKNQDIWAADFRMGLVSTDQIVDWGSGTNCFLPNIRHFFQPSRQTKMCQIWGSKSSFFQVQAEEVKNLAPCWGGKPGRAIWASFWMTSRISNENDDMLVFWSRYHSPSGVPSGEHTNSY